MARDRREGGREGEKEGERREGGEMDRGRERRKKEEKEREGGEGERERGGKEEREEQSLHTQCLGIPAGIPPPPQLTCCGFEQLLLPRGHNTIGSLTVQVHMCMYSCGCARALPGRGGGVASAASHSCLSLCPLLSLAPSLLSA